MADEFAGGSDYRRGDVFLTVPVSVRRDFDWIILPPIFFRGIHYCLFCVRRYYFAHGGTTSLGGVCALISRPGRILVCVMDGADSIIFRANGVSDSCSEFFGTVFA